jgi:6-phosphofructokinase 1
MKGFVCHSNHDSEFVMKVVYSLNPDFESLFAYEESQRTSESFITTISKALKECDTLIVFIGANLSYWQVDEVNAVFNMSRSGQVKSFLFIELPTCSVWPTQLELLSTYPRQKIVSFDDKCVMIIRDFIISSLARERSTADGLPRNPHIFRYEKDIIAYFTQRLVTIKTESEERGDLIISARRGNMWLDGCPDKWPDVVLLQKDQSPTHPVPGLLEDDVGKWRPLGARVVAAALAGYHTGDFMDVEHPVTCQIKHGLCFPEAGPREKLFFPPRGTGLRAAVLVSGGIAPGINAVIDGIVQRHYMYANPGRYADPVRYRETQSYDIEVRGMLNGFRAFDDPNDSLSYLRLLPNHDERGTYRHIVTSDHANKGGSMIGTSRVDELIDGSSRSDRLDMIVDGLLNSRTDILYVIGGDGSMKAAHAIWTIAHRRRGPNRRLMSVIGIPKTMDNDILWVWQSFGFLSAVEKAREVIGHLSTEVTSNPRLCVVQLFGSDSGFVVSHAILASQTGQCDVALVPEVEFSMKGLARFIKSRIHQRKERIPRALVVMAETAVPTDALDFIDDETIALSDNEKEAIRKFDRLRSQGNRIQGQTDDKLRSAGLKIVSLGLHKLLPIMPVETHDNFEPSWSEMRAPVVNEPRHLLRAIPPSCSDIIMGQRLGTLAVDNAMAGYTDCMISQWLTEYVLVPLELVVMGRKRIPGSGIFWKSVMAKTGQPATLV